MPRPVAWPWPTRRCRWPTWGRPGGGRHGETRACAWCSRPSGARPPREARGRRRGGAALRAESRRIVVQLVTEENITDLAAERWATARDPRLAELMTALVRHLHDFAREVRLTEAEWMAAIQWLTRTGQISDDKREEFILASDVLGLSMLVVQMNHRLDPAATPATVLGPFHIEGSPEFGYGEDMSQGLPGTPLLVHGTVRDLAGNPVPGAVLDIWQADAEGAYESQVADVDEARLRAKYTTREDGGYCLRTIAPKGYSIPMDGPAGELICRAALRQ